MTPETRATVEAIARKKIEQAVADEKRAAELEQEAAELRKKAAAARAVAKEMATLEARGAPAPPPAIHPGKRPPANKASV
jgi:hypothetical protein